MSKLMLVEQPFGIGDICYTQSLINDFIKDGYDIIWPVQDHFVGWLNEAYPKIKFIPVSLIRPEMIEVKKDCEINGMRILPIRFAEHIMGRPYKYHMVSKYELFGKDWQMWERDALPTRNISKEKELRAALGITKGMKYNFVHTKFGSNGQHKITINPNNDYPNIEMRLNDGFSFFNYCGIIEGAEEIHSVSSGTLYLYCTLSLNASSVHIYNRTGIEKNLDYVRFLLPNNFTLHE